MAVDDVSVAIKCVRVVTAVDHGVAVEVGQTVDDGRRESSAEWSRRSRRRQRDLRVEGDQCEDAEQRDAASEISDVYGGVNRTHTRSPFEVGTSVAPARSSHDAVMSFAPNPRPVVARHAETSPTCAQTTARAPPSFRSCETASVRSSETPPIASAKPRARYHSRRSGIKSHKTPRHGVERGLESSNGSG